MCRRRPTHPHMRGRWRGERPRPQYTNYSPDGPPSQASEARITLPFYSNRFADKPKLVTREESQVLLLPRKGRSRKCRITRLPMEILLQIAEYLVPTDNSFHIFPTTKEQWLTTPRITIVHKFSEAAPKEEDRPRSNTRSIPRAHLTAFARTCRVLSEAYYATMYARNHFIIELSSDLVYPVIEGPVSLAVESWTKLCRGKRQGMWPLTKDSIPYVKNLIILGTLDWEGSDLAKTTLRKHLRSAIGLLKQARDLKSLTVDMRCSPAPYNPKKAPRQPPLPASDLIPKRRLGWGVQGLQDTVLRLHDVTTIETMDRYLGLVEFWKLFEDLRGVRDVLLSGYITPEMVEGLRTKMMSVQQPLQAAKDTLEAPVSCQHAGSRTQLRKEAAESKKSDLKRKRGIEASKPRKSPRPAKVEWGCCVAK